jgi:hypothetical protein
VEKKKRKNKFTPGQTFPYSIVEAVGSYILPVPVKKYYADFRHRKPSVQEYS